MQPYVPDPRWRLNPLADLLPCRDRKHKPDWWNSDNRNALAAIKLCSLECPLRLDCYYEGLTYGDIGVVRGGYKLTSNSAKLAVCEECRAHSVRTSRTKTFTRCTVCMNTHTCKGCKKKFYAEARGNKTPSEYCTRSCKVDQVVKRLKAMRAKEERKQQKLLKRLGPVIARLKAQLAGA